MKKSILIIAAATFFTSTLTTSCKSNSDKEADAQEEVIDAQNDLNETEQDVEEDQSTKANDAEWLTYKAEAMTTIDANEARIMELKKAIKKSGTTFDAAYEKSINDLEKRNSDLKTKIANYENNQTDWASFKREFSSDMTELGNALKDLTVNNKK
jgi:chromosome segregation ATPase